jgi:hypothetical protein
MGCSPYLSKRQKNDFTRHTSYDSHKLPALKLTLSKPIQGPKEKEKLMTIIEVRSYQESSQVIG